MGKYDGIVNVTLDGEVYKKLKDTQDGLIANKHPIRFGGNRFYEYEWDFYTTDQALVRMADEYQFMLYKHDMNLINKEIEQRNRIKELELELEWLKNRND